jgi:predicted permease
MFGASKAIYVALALAVGAITISPLTLAILGANKPSPNGEMGAGLAFRAVGRALINPVVLSPIAGIVFAFLGIPLPQAVTDALMLIGQATGGVALFLTGLILSSQRLLLNSNVVSGVLLKNVALPLVVAGLALLLPMSREAARAAILLAALPSGFFGVLFGLTYRIESREVGSTLILSSVVSIVTLPLGLILTAGL